MRIQITKEAKIKILSALKNGNLDDLEFIDIVTELCNGLTQKEVEDLTMALGTRLGDKGLLYRITPEEAAVFVREMTKNYGNG